MAEKVSFIARRSDPAEEERLNQAVRLSIRKLGAVAAWRFLNAPNESLDGRRPVDLLKAPNGLQKFRDLLDRPSSARPNGI